MGFFYKILEILCTILLAITGLLLLATLANPPQAQYAPFGYLPSMSFHPGLPKSVVSGSTFYYQTWILDKDTYTVINSSPTQFVEIPTSSVSMSHSIDSGEVLAIAPDMDNGKLTHTITIVAKTVTVTTNFVDEHTFDDNQSMLLDDGPAAVSYTVITVTPPQTSGGGGAGGGSR